MPRNLHPLIAYRQAHTPTRSHVLLCKLSGTYEAAELSTIAYSICALAFARTACKFLFGMQQEMLGL